jgi:hypothetical protein
MPITPEALYVQLGQLIESMPDLENCEPSDDVHRWLGRASALVAQGPSVVDGAQMNTAAQSLFTRPLRRIHASTIVSILHRHFAHAELAAPASSAGAFIPAGGAFDAFAQVGKVMGAAKVSLLIVDPYADEKVLTQYALQARKGVVVQILADAKHHKATLNPAAAAWVQQYGAAWRLEVRLAPAKALHDRLLIIDQKEVWSLTQSLNAFAARAPASIVRVNDELAAMKVQAYEPIWKAAQVVV